jgi:hypothetical protein
VQRDRVPSDLDAGIRDIMMLEELTHCVRAINFKPVIGAPELLEQAEIMKGRTDKQELHIELLAGLAAHFVGPEEGTMRMVEQERCAELSQQTGCLARQLAVWNAGFHVLELG